MGYGQGLFIKTINGNMYRIDVDPDDTLLAFKQKASDALQIPLEDLRFNWVGKELKVGSRFWCGVIEHENVAMSWLDPGVREGYPPVFVIIRLKEKEKE